MKNKKNILYSILISVLAAFGLFFFFNILTPSENYNYGFVFIFIFFLLYLLAKEVILNINKRIIIFSFINSFVISTILTIGIQLENFSIIIWSCSTLLKIVLLSFFFFIPISAFYNYCISHTTTVSTNNFISKHYKAISFTVILFFWLLTYLAVFPGVYGYDSGFQYLEFASSSQAVNTRFSIAYSYLFYQIVHLGYTFFKSYVIGFAIYSLLQMMFLVFVASKICTYVYKRTENIIYLVVSILFFALNPLFSVLAVSSSQDPIFAGIFALLILETFKFVESRTYYFSSIKNTLIYIFLLLLLFVSRNNGIYMFIFVVPFLLFYNKKHILKTFIIILLPIIMLKFYNISTINLFNAEKGNSLQEMFSVPGQQFARAYNYNSENLTEDEKTDLEVLISKFALENYPNSQSIADVVKGYTNTNLLKSDPQKYIKLYFSVFKKSPKQFIEAFALNTLGFWNPEKNYYDSRMVHPYLEFYMLEAKKHNPDYIEIQRHSFLPHYEKILEKLVAQNYFSKIPIISSFLKLGTYFTLFITVLIFILYKKSYKYLVPLSYVFGLYITLFLSPVALFRYGFPILLITPVYFNIFFQKKEEQQQ
jgi:hypothetical protein